MFSFHVRNIHIEIIKQGQFAKNIKKDTCFPKKKMSGRISPEIMKDKKISITKKTIFRNKKATYEKEIENPPSRIL